MCVSPDYNVIEDTTWPTFERVARELKKWVRGVKSPVPRAWFRTEDGGMAELVFKSAEKPDKLRGPNKAGLWFDEASVMKLEAFYTAFAVLRWKRRMGPCLLTFTPRGRRHWTFSTFYEEVDEGELELLSAGHDGASLLDDITQYERIADKWYRRKKGAALVHATSAENPFLPPEYVDVVGGHLSSAMKAQELGGEFIDLAGLFFAREWFYPLVDEVPVVAQRVRYWDRAGTKGGGCFSAGVLMARTDNGLFWVEDVRRGQWSSEERNRAIVETAREDASRYGNTVQVWGEQEGGSAGKEISEQFIKMLAGYPVYRDIVSGKGTKLIDGLELPHKPKIVRAQGLIAQAEAGNIKLKRAKWNTDFLDELCLAGDTKILTIAGWKEIHYVRQGDLVWTRQGWKTVVKCRQTNPHAVIGKITLSNGLSLRSTNTHPVYVESKGFVSAIHAEVGDELLCCTAGLGSMSTPTTKSDRRSGILMGGTKTIDRTCIDLFMSAKSGQFQTDTTSTTRIATPWTTGPKTWNARPAISTTATTMPPVTSSVASPSRQSVSGAERITRPGNAGDPRRAARSAPLGYAGPMGSGRLGMTTCASDVGSRFVTSRRRPDSAPRSASEKLTGKIGDYQRSGARFAEPCFSQWDQGLNVAGANVRRSWELIGAAPVWNLEVEGQHEYFADGILVHNCMFPESDICDQVDSAAGSLNKLCKMWTTDPGHTYRIAPQVDGERFGVHLDKSGGSGGRRRV